MDKLKAVAEAVINGDDDEVKTSVRKALDSGVAPMEVINKGLVAGLDVVGQKFQSGEMFVPEMLLSAIASGAGIELAKAGLKPGEFKPKATMVLGTVRGDVHDIGKNLVALVLASRGFEVINLGVDIHEAEFVEAVKKYQPQFVGMSALLTTTMAHMKDVIDALAKEGMRNKVKVVVGGAPLNVEFARHIGADGYAQNMGEAAVIIERLLAGKAG